MHHRPQASISMIRDQLRNAWLTLTRSRWVVNAGKVTLRLTSRLPLTVASRTHAEPSTPPR